MGYGRERETHIQITTAHQSQRYKRSAKPLARSSTMTCANKCDVIILVQGWWSHRPPLMYPETEQ